MKKRIILLPMLLVSSFNVLANAGEGYMAGSNMMGGTGELMLGSLFGLFYMVVASFVFSLVFWGTYKWLIEDKKKKK